MQEIARMRIQCAAEMIKFVFYLLDDVGPSDRHARNDIAVPIEVLCAAVQGEVKTDFRRPEVDWASKRVVYHGHKLVRFCELDDRFEITHTHPGLTLDTGGDVILLVIHYP